MGKKRSWDCRVLPNHTVFSALAPWVCPNFKNKRHLHPLFTQLQSGNIQVSQREEGNSEHT